MGCLTRLFDFLSAAAPGPRQDIFIVGLVTQSYICRIFFYYMYKGLINDFVQEYPVKVFCFKIIDKM